ncbi:MAG: hypothetical protein ACRDZX_15610 [Acidimicrobiales bacterium]
MGVALGGTRVLLGVALLAAPSLARLWVGAAGRTPGGRVLSRSLAARDLALGAGAIFARGHPERLRTWVSLAALGDLVDTLGTAAASGLAKPARVLVTLSSAGAAAAGTVAAFSLPADDQACG